MAELKLSACPPASGLVHKPASQVAASSLIQVFFTPEQQLKGGNGTPYVEVFGICSGVICFGRQSPTQAPASHQVIVNKVFFVSQMVVLLTCRVVSTNLVRNTKGL